MSGFDNLAQLSLQGSTDREYIIFINFMNDSINSCTKDIPIMNSSELRSENKGVIRLCSGNTTNGSTNNEVVAWRGSSVQQKSRKKNEKLNT